MLIENYLPTYHFREVQSIKIAYSSEDMYQKMLSCDLSQSFLIRFLFRLRGMRQKLSTIQDIEQLGFVKLDEKPGEEILFGIVTTSPTFSNCLPIKSPADFRQLSDEQCLRAVINFRVVRASTFHHVSTETRILCGSEKMKDRFQIYWFFVRPFSRIIRRVMLRQLKLQLK